MAQLIATADDTDSFNRARQVLHQWSHLIQEIDQHRADEGLLNP